MTIRCLVIEDSFTDRKVVEKAIQSANSKHDIDNMTIKNVTSIKEAIHVLHLESYDIVITDLALPDSKGIDTIKAIREFTSAPILIISGSYDKNVIRTALETGISYYIQKGESWARGIASIIKLLLKEAEVRNNLKGVNNVV